MAIKAEPLSLVEIVTGGKPDLSRFGFLVAGDTIIATVGFTLK
jgi:hypothetical protein